MLSEADVATIMKGWHSSPGHVRVAVVLTIAAALGELPQCGPVAQKITAAFVHKCPACRGAGGKFSGDVFAMCGRCRGRRVVIREVGA